jgi:hypothetical protein
MKKYFLIYFVYALPASSWKMQAVEGGSEVFGGERNGEGRPVAEARKENRLEVAPSPQEEPSLFD